MGPVWVYRKHRPSLQIQSFLKEMLDSCGYNFVLYLGCVWSLLHVLKIKVVSLLETGNMNNHKILLQPFKILKQSLSDLNW